jgi:hypothetical protein
MPRKKDTERFSVRLPACLAKGLREAADRHFHGDVNAAIAAWTRFTTAVRADAALG